MTSAGGKQGRGRSNQQHGSFSGLVAHVAVIALTVLWSTLESRDAALMPGAAHGPPELAATYAGWPAAGTWCKLLYLLWNLPALSMHCLVWNM